MRALGPTCWIGLLAGVLTGASLGCSDIFGPDLPDGAVPFNEVPAAYQGWWWLAERCSGMQGRLEEVSWYFIPGSTTIPGSDGAVAEYHRGRHRIVLAEGYVRDGFTVRHEMLHALQGGGGHPRGLFLETCGAVVSCGAECQADAGPLPDWYLGHPVASEEDLALSVHLLPPKVSLSGDTPRCVSIGIGLTNLSDVPKTFDVQRGRAFSWLLDGWGEGSGGGPILVDSLIALEPSRPWIWVADCPQVFRDGLPPGQYTVRGRVQDLTSEPVTLTVVP